MSGEGGYAHLPSPLGNNKGVSFVVILKKLSHMIMMCIGFT